jgi:DNA-binding MarR family transcriptional regulator
MPKRVRPAGPGGLDEGTEHGVDREIDHEVVDALITASRALVGLAVRSVNAAPVDITVTQHRALVLLATQGEQSVGALADQLRIDASNGTRLCDRLQRLGLVERFRSPVDGRAVNVSLTAAGRRVLEEVRAHRRRELGRILRDVPPDGVQAMVDALTAFTRAAHEAGETEWVAHTL